MFTITGTRSLRASVTSVWSPSPKFTVSSVYTDHNRLALGVSVDDLNAACERLEGLQVNWKKRLTDGRMHNVAFVLDPDGYWIEVIQNETLKRSSNW